MWPARYFADSYWGEDYFSHSGFVIMASEGGATMLTGAGG